MRRSLALLIMMAALRQASAEPALKDMLAEAASCSDASLQSLASRSCDSPETVAEQALATCQAKWNAVASKAIGVSPGQAVPARQRGTLKVYSDAMENEYVRVAELKVIDMRRADRLCGFD